MCILQQEVKMEMLLPFNPKSVVILDNAAIHHAHRAIELIEETGALAVFLHPIIQITCQLKILF